MSTTERAAVRSKVYIDGKARPFEVTDLANDIEDALDDADRAMLSLTNRYGDLMLVRKDRVTGVSEVREREPEVKADPFIFDGRKVTFRDYGAYRRDGLRENERTGGLMRYDDYPAGTVAVVAEDLGDVLVLAVETDGTRHYENLASAPEALDRLARAVRLVAEAETLQLEADKVTYPSGPAPEAASSYEEAENAKTADEPEHWNPGLRD